METTARLLWDACGKLGIARPKPFESIEDFKAWMLDRFHPAPHVDATHYIAVLAQAAKDAEHGREAAVVESLKTLLRLAERQTAGNA